MGIRELFQNVSESVFGRSEVPVLCRECNTFIAVPKQRIFELDITDSPCCGGHLVPPPKHTSEGQKWDNFGGERDAGKQLEDLTGRD